MNDSKWQKLIELARKAPVDTEASAPYAFSTRVVAQAFSETSAAATSVSAAKIYLRAMGVAGLIAVVTVAANLKPVLNNLDDDVATLSDPTVEVSDTSA